MANAGLRPPFMTVAMWFAWLLRGDVRAGHAATDPQAQREFVSWWILFGVNEYPKVGWYGREQVDVAMASVPTPSGTKLPALLLRLHQARSDLQDCFDLSDPDQVGGYLCWYRLEASRELPTAPALPPWAVALTETPSQSYLPPAVPRMALALWSRSDELRRVMNLEQPGARRGLCHWYAKHGKQCIPRPPPLPAGPEIRPVRRAHAGSLVGVPISLVGFARAEFGLGEDVRLVSRALEAQSVEHTIADVRTGSDIRTQDTSRLNWLAPPSHGITVFCMTAFDAAECFLVNGPDAFDNAYNIGYWPWELPRLPLAWRDAYELVDEVWASTRFQMDAYGADGVVPVFLMPPAVTPTQCRMPPRRPPALLRAFRFLYVFDPNSTLARKNPLTAVRAFRRAFPRSDRTVHLVLRVNGTLAGRPGAKELLAAVAHDRRVCIHEGTVSRKHAQRILQQADCFISPHRSEGFGRNVAEAIAYGVPVLATAFSGTADLVARHEQIASKPKRVGRGEYPHGEGQWWCEPDISQLAAKMRRLRQKRPRTRQIVYLRRARLQLQRYSIKVAGQRYQNAIGRIVKSAEIRASKTAARPTYAMRKRNEHVKRLSGY